MEYNGKEWKQKKEGVYVCGEEFLCTSIEYVNRKTLGFSPVRGYSTPEGYFIFLFFYFLPLWSTMSTNRTTS